MYSRNDYRYYLEHRLEESDDYLAHYGVKGMKWKKHKVTEYDPNMGTWTRSTIFEDGKGKGVVLSKSRDTRTDETAAGISFVNTRKRSKSTPSINKIGRISTVNQGNSKTIAVDTSNKKKVRKKKVRNLIKVGKQATGIIGDLSAWNASAEHEWRQAEREWNRMRRKQA